MGFRTVAIARGKDKEPLAKQLGAVHYIDTQSADPSAELAKLGGATAVIATVTNGPAMAATLGGLIPRGRLMVLGAGEGTIDASPLLLRLPPRHRRLVFRHLDRRRRHTRLQRSVRRPFDERVLSPGKVPEAYDRMLSGKARFRVVLTMEK